MTIVRKEQIIRRKFQKNRCVSRVTFIYSIAKEIQATAKEIQVQVRYQSGIKFDQASEHIRKIAEELNYKLKNIRYDTSSKNYEYSIFYLEVK